jgi:ferredoxin
MFKDIARECGADDVGIIELGRASIAPQLPYIAKVYAKTRSLLCYIKRTNKEPVRSPTRSVANEEYHSTYDEVNHVGRDFVRKLTDMGIGACNSVSAFPMEMNEAKTMMVQHKPIAIEAGLGKMGVHRNVIHPKYGSFVVLGTILIDADFDAYDQPIDYNPCLSCKLCVAACPVSALKPDGAFDFSTCYTHNYHDFRNNFTQWVEQIADSQDAKDFRRRVPDTENNNIWQSLSFKPQYKASYCISVCPAGEDVISPFLEDRSAFIDDIVKPLMDKKETLYVIKGSDADESVPRKFPHKTIRHVRAGRHTDSVPGHLFNLRLSFQRGQAKGLDLRVHWTFTGSRPQMATVHIKGKLLDINQRQHVGEAAIHVVVDAALWFDILNRNVELDDAIDDKRLVVHGDIAHFRDYMRCFPF